MTLEPIVSATWLSKHLTDDGVRVVDVRWYLDDPDRGRREYEAAHLPGAAFMDLETDLSAPEGPGRHPLPDPAAFAARVGELGFHDTDHIVIYDDSAGAIAARLWWQLRHIGHSSVSVLNGGFGVWRASGLPVTDTTETHSPANFTVRGVRSDTVNREQLSDQLGSVVLLDARAAPRYRGDEEPIDPAAGHIPTAVNAPFTENLAGDGTFKSPEELARRFEALGVGNGVEVVVSCGSGVTACHDILALHVAGSAKAMLYPGSWSDWSASGYPIATGDEPGTVPHHIA